MAIRAAHNRVRLFMFDTIILLTGPAEHSVFTTLLRGHNPGLTVLPVFTADDLTAIEQEWLGRARLIAFSTNVIVPGAVLGQLGYGAYHFHPGSPQYPGRTPARAALDNGASVFGGTVHRMVERVDAGAIVDVESFAIPEGATVAGLEELAYTTLVGMFWRLAAVLSNQEMPLLPRAVRWGVPSPRHAGPPAIGSETAAPTVRLPTVDLPLVKVTGERFRLHAVAAEAADA
jgi:methionyl-tRNA formyltransferase